MLKTCTTCKVAKSFSDFSKCKTNRYGLSAYCKVCKKANQQKNYKLKKVEYDERVRLWRSQHPEAQKRWSQVQWARFREKILARGAVYRAVKNGLLEKELCRCGKVGQAHHLDYKKPLDVIWLCVRHHKEIHQSQYKA